MVDPIVLQALAVLLAGLLLGTLVRRRGVRRDDGDAVRDKRVESLDTVAAWPPQATRVLTLKERKAQLMLAQALPEYTVLGQVPLARFIRVPTRHSYHEWMRRVGQLCADLVVCDALSQVVAVVELRRPDGGDGERSRRRHERMDRVLQQAGIRVLVWNEDGLPDPAAVRDLVLTPPPGLHSDEGAARVRTRPADVAPAADGRPAVVTLHDVLEELDREAMEATTLAEPAPSTWFDDLSSSAAMPLEAPKR